MAGSYVVHIGGGLYLDEAGGLTTGPQTGAQVYQVPGGFKIDAKKLQDTFKDLGGLLPSSAADVEKWVSYGAPRELVTLLSKISGIASIAATAISVYVWAVGVMLTIMSLMTQDDGLSPELAKTLYSIKNQLSGLEEIDRAGAMIEMHAALDGRIDLVNGLLRRLSVEKPIGAMRAAVFAQMRTIVDELAVPLSQIRDQEWAATYNADAYKGRGFLAGVLVFEKSDGTAPAVPIIPPTVTHFDYRLGVPMLLFTATTYTSLAQVAMPWFRSAGMYAGQLRKTADAIDRFVIRMQDECLSRTQYSPQMVMEQQLWSVFEIPVGGGPRSWNPYPSYAVGAFDLVRYDDAFLWDCYGREFTAGQETGPRGLFNYHWWPSAQVNMYDYDTLAPLFNEKAEQDYTSLQVATGMLHLIQVAALLRFLSTPPDRSQTIDGYARDTRSFLDATPATATSPSIFPVGVIESPATSKRYRAANIVRARTQEPNYVPAFRYRVVLRTLRSGIGSGGWRHLDYVGDVWRPGYEPTAADPRVQRLRTDFRSGFVLSETVLYDGPSPTDAVHRSGEETIAAPTFDWYLPVGPAIDLSDSVAYADSTHGQLLAGRAPGRGSGGVSPHLSDSLVSERSNGAVSTSTVLTGLSGNVVPPGTATRSGQMSSGVISDILDVGDGISLQDRALDSAERRHVAEEQVHLGWQLDWSQGLLDVRLSGRPDDRPFQVHVIVEEVVYSGDVVDGEVLQVPDEGILTERIHTAFTAEMVNQVLEVPRSFFIKEGKALADAAKRWHDFLTHYAEQRPIGPGDPIESLDKAIRDMATISSSTASLAHALNERAEFAARAAPALWDAATKNIPVSEEHR